jgi:uncharacterized protein (DUF1800 family)
MDAKAWLAVQLEGPADQPRALDGIPFMTGGQLVQDMIAFQRDRAMEKKNGTIGQDPAKLFRTRVAIYNSEVAARYALGFTTVRPFAERLVRFWSNHFVVSAQNPRAVTLVGAFEREAIRPNIHRTFEDMLLAVVTHPAMLMYLDNAQSVGPDSIGAMRSGKGLNENLGRELMELYTLGVNGGYTQADVIAMAELLTGFSIDRKGTNGFQFVTAIHEPGTITLRGKTYPSGQEGTLAAIHDLARDPATARHIARKFATHFISDTPSEESCARLERSFAATRGDLRALAETAIADPHAWSPGLSKMRTPVEYITASFRLLGWPRDGDQAKQVQGAIGAARLMGEVPLSPPAPKGWPDASEAWSGANAVLNRIEWARQVGNRLAQSLDTAAALATAVETLGPLLWSATKVMMAQATIGGDALALLLSSPEFQRR